MAPHWQLLRVYGAGGFARTLLELIREEGLDLKVMLGIWIAPEDRPEAAAANRREIAAGVALSGEFPDVVAAVCVSNETQVSWSPYPCPIDQIQRQVREVRSAVRVPVTVADDYQYWLEPRSAALASELDFLTVHAHPLWNGQQLDDALPWLKRQLEAVRAAHPDRPLVIGETGWATAVSGQGEQARLIKGKVGEAEQAHFIEELRLWARATGVSAFVFEAFDENWKGGADPADVEKHWGLFHADRTPKAALGG
jgi:exo-beta-1,3-glucanase (GH17 family)